MSKQKKHGFLFYCIAILFYPITICVLIFKKIKSSKLKESNDEAPVYNSGANHEGALCGVGKDELYKIILPSWPKKECDALPHDKLQAAACISANNGAHIIEDCDRFINETLTPKTFFDRLDILEARLYENAVIEKFFPNMFNSSALKQYNNFKRYYTSTVNEFIDRYYNSTYEKMLQLATANAQKNYIEKKYNELKIFTRRMPSESIDYFRSKFNKLFENLNLCFSD